LMVKVTSGGLAGRGVGDALDGQVDARGVPRLRGYGVRTGNGRVELQVALRMWQPAQS